jgi:hypothetical protein
VVLSALALLLGGVVGLALGGSIRHLATWRFRSWWLLGPGLLGEIAADRWHLAGLGTVVLLAAYGCLLLFVARNILLVGMGVVAVGLLTNLAVITVNSGMPVHSAALVKAGIAAPDQLAAVAYGRRHHPETGGDHLTFLDDRLPLGTVHQVLSIGDLILAVGMGDVIANLVRHPRRRRATWDPPAPAVRAHLTQSWPTPT